MQFAISSRSLEAEFKNSEPYHSHPGGSGHDLTASWVRIPSLVSQSSRCICGFLPAIFWLRLPGKSKTKRFQKCPLRTHTCRRHPGHSRAGVWRAGESGLLSLTRHGRSDGWGAMLFELSVGLAGYRYGNAEEPVFFRDDRGQRELSDGVGPCGAMGSFFSSHLDQLDAGRTGQGGKLADRLNRPRGPSTGALNEVEPEFSHLHSRGEYLGESDVAVGVPKQEKRGPDEVTV